MKIDHMIFNSKKWYEGNQPNYIGCSIQIPSHKAKIQLYSLPVSGAFGGSGMPDELSAVILTKSSRPSANNDGTGVVWINSIDGKKIYGQMDNGDGDIYLLIVCFSSDTYMYGYYPSYIKLSDLIKNGGDYPPLSHIWQALRAFTARKAVNA